MESFFARVWRWHFWIGLLVSPVLFVVALTGAIHVFHEEIEDWKRADVRFVEPLGTHKPLSEQLAALTAAHPDWKPTRITLPDDPRRSTMIQVNRPGAPRGTLWVAYVDPYRAEVVADGDARSPFFTAVLKTHRSLFAGTFGRIVVELTTSWVLVLLVSGAYLWLPKPGSSVWGVWLPRWWGKPDLLLRDLHAVGAIYLLPIMAAIALTGLVFSVIWLGAWNKVTGGAGNFPIELITAPPAPAPTKKSSVTAIDVAVATARERFPRHVLYVDLPRRPTAAILVTAQSRSGPSVSGSIAVDPSSGDVLSEKRIENLTTTRQARLYALPIHVGTIAGPTTKLPAFLASLMLAGLAISGPTMWLLRRPGGKTGFPPLSKAAIPKAAVALILLFAVTLPTVGASLLLVLGGEWLVTRWSRPRSTNLNPPPDEPNKRYVANERPT